jgi:2-keto-4-pentenoate hydratase/2-oxohepta-3-ene-1,7-dioic acid hydratase in catechol pathway
MTRRDKTGRKWPEYSAGRGEVNRLISQAAGLNARHRIYSPDVKYATFSLAADPRPRPGLVDGDRIIDLSAHAPTLIDLIREGPPASARGPAHPLRDIRWHAPIPRPPKNVFCVGRNYAAHVKEGAAAQKHDGKLPDVPVFFTKAPTAVTGPFDAVPRHRGITEQMDWEAELGVVIGRAGRNIGRDAALAHVFGYTVLNDFTARDLQTRHTQWFKGKSLDGSCPIGPVIVTADEFGDPQAKRVSLRVNGVTKQDAATADMIFPVATIIEWLSKGLTLEPGDLIATGTPEGVGMGRTPQEWLRDGDVVETEVEGIGVMRNRIVDVDV